MTIGKKTDTAIRNKGRGLKTAFGVVEIVTRIANRLSTGNKAL
jgi:hypothetical protein